MKCPVFNCRYEVPVDLEDVARERHRAAHSTEQWASVVSTLREQQDGARERCAAEITAVAADLARVQQWIGEDS